MAFQVLLKTACVDDVAIHAFRETRTHRLRITGVTIQGQLAVPTLSFWRTMFGEIGLASCVGPRFDEYTWFLRLRSAHPFLVFRYAIAIDQHGNAMLLGVPRRGLASWNVTDGVLEPDTSFEADGGFEDQMAERLSLYWQEPTDVSVPPGFMDTPAGTLPPSMN